MPKAEKMVRSDGKVLVRCPQCKHWRDGHSYLIGEKDPKKKECWVPKCEYCRKPDALLEKVGYPGGEVQVTDKAENCFCHDGTFKFSNGAVGIHFRCQGKGWCSWADMARNYYFDLKQSERMVRSDEAKSNTESPEPTPDSGPEEDLEGDFSLDWDF